MLGYGYGYGYYGFDSTYLLVLLGVVLSVLASSRVKTTFARYQRVRSRSGMTGAQTAERILRSAGIYDVRVQRVSGNLTDHYDPRSKVLRLSDSVYDSASIAAIGVAAHECGHAVQHDKGYTPLSIRSALVPLANFGSQLSWPIFFAGLIFAIDSLLGVGILLFLAAVLFQLITLPVEFNASRRALQMLQSNGILGGEEIRGTRKVLNAAALTYVASLAASVLQLLRLVILAGGRRRND